MKVSLNTVKQFINLDLSVSELVEKINAQLGGVEEVIDLGVRYKDALIVRVVSAEKHPNADRLKVTKIDDGGIHENVKRDENGYIQVVCGAPNAHAGMLAVWLPPGSVVPESFENDEPFRLDARELRGKFSYGMLASAKELAIGDDHDGIIEINEYDLPQGISGDNLAGQSFAKVFSLDDQIIDIENKMFTHRPDLFGQLGVAREIYAITSDDLASAEPTGDQFKNTDWYSETPQFSEAQSLKLEVFNDAPESVPRFMAVAIENVEVKTSPLWLRCKLVAFGAKSVNNIVDITNYVMLMSGQPTHAYDYDKLHGNKIGVRMAREGEETKLLNGKTYQLSSDDIVVADNQNAIGLGGVMGGFDSEVTDETRNIVIEVANFDMYSIRKTSMRHGLFTDAVTRFNKGQSPIQIDRIIKYLIDIMPGEQASHVFDLPEYSGPNDTSVHGEIRVSPEFINDRLGTKLASAQIGNILRTVNFSVTHEDDELVIAAPFWRTDIELAEDVVEEVGRLYGFDKLPRELPRRSIKPASKNPMRELKRNIRQTLARAGANEVLTYSFVHEKLLKNANQNPDNSYELSNSLSPELKYYRQSLSPSLLAHVHANIKAGHDEFALFELGKSHKKSLGLTDENVPVETRYLAFTYAAKKPGSGAAFYRAKRYLGFLSDKLGLEMTVEPISDELASPEFVSFEIKRSGKILDKSSSQLIGFIGEYKKSVAKSFKLPEYAAGFELNIDALLELLETSTSIYLPLSRYPVIERDISIQVSTDALYSAVMLEVKRALSSINLVIDVSPVGIYEPVGAGTKNVTIKIKMRSHDCTLSSDDADETIKVVTNWLFKKLNAKIV